MERTGALNSIQFNSIQLNLELLPLLEVSLCFFELNLEKPKRNKKVLEKLKELICYRNNAVGRHKYTRNMTQNPIKNPSKIQTIKYKYHPLRTKAVIVSCKRS